MSGRAALLARLLDPAALGRYEGLTLRVRRGMGQRPGERRFPGHPQPSGTEIESYNAYVAGDDLRHLDWNAVGRLDALLVRRYTAEREVVFHVLVDCSASMAVPAGRPKLAAALELAMAAAAMALGANDAARIALLPGGDEPARVSPVLRQRASIPRAAEFLAQAVAAGSLDLGTALARYADAHAAGGNAIVISDYMMDPTIIERGVHALQARRFDVQLLQIIARAELEPEREFTHALLADAESDDTHPVALTPATLARYHELLDGHLAAVAALAARRHAPYVLLATDRSIGELLTDLGERGIVGRR